MKRSGLQYLNRRRKTRERNVMQRKYKEEGFPGCIGAVDSCKLR